MSAQEQKIGESTIMLPVVPTVDVVVFPHMIIPLLVVDGHIIEGIQKILDDKDNNAKEVLVVACKQTDSQVDRFGPEDLFEVGTVVSIMRMIKNPQGGIKILVNGLRRAHIQSFLTHDSTLKCLVEPYDFDYAPSDTVGIDIIVQTIKDQTRELSERKGSINSDFSAILTKMTEPEKIADFLISHLSIDVIRAQKLLEEKSFIVFLKQLYDVFIIEAEASKVHDSINQSTREAMSKSQKEYYLREQLKVIKKELGEDDNSELAEIIERAHSVAMSEEAYAEFEKAIHRIEKMSPDSMEASVLRTHLEWLVNLPWGTETVDNLDLNHAQKVLDEDHYGLREIKERILDFISVRKLKKDGHAPIMCFVGPPGTGKTSLGKSIARCLGRNYFRISLGGVKDESEIRGHRRTYVGAMPGRFIQGMKKSGSMNPLIIIDEIDKIGADFKGDPSAALLEVLDPSQNSTFYDNYLNIPFDLSKVLFIATANSLDTISEPLRDRMEIITLSGYTQEEKREIATRHLIKKALCESGIDCEKVHIDNAVISDIIANYTREAGVRELDRLIRKIGSKAARLLVEKEEVLKCSCANLENYLGPRKFIDDTCDKHHQIGIANGLAWTVYGGEIIQIEAMIMPGAGKLTITGHLGDVMKESIQAALSYARAHASEFAIEDVLFTDHDLHVHVPAGAVPKDGPSAGITMLSAILSAYTKRPINGEYAMTGEINLRGSVMPIGGLKEKILAAKRNGISHVILPAKNKPELFGMEDVLDGMDIIWVSHANDILERVLMPLPQVIA